MSKDGRIWLSHTGIESLNRCPRCFWIQYKKGVRQPEGIVSRLANRFDIILKGYFDSFRQKDEMPPLIQEIVGCKLENPFQEKYFVRLNDSYGFLGKLDECFVLENGLHIPVDFKTSSSDPRNRETLPAYQSQIDDYLFIMKENGKSIGDFGYLIYIYPDVGEVLHDKFPMIIHVQKLSGDPTKTKERIEKAITVLEGPMPEKSSTCPFCTWYDRIKELIGDSKQKSGFIQQNLLDDIA